jgi:hypothetical protein
MHVSETGKDGDANHAYSVATAHKGATGARAIMQKVSQLATPQVLVWPTWAPGLAQKFCV